MEKRIAILVDNPARDLPACTLLAADLSQSFKVFLVPTAQANTDLFRLQPDLVLLNYLRENNRPMVERLVKCGIQFSILDTEGGLFMDVPNTSENTYTMTLIQDAQLRNKVAQVFVWGKSLYELLKKREIYPQKSLLCLGTPRMDFFSKAFANYFIGHDQNQTRPMILINTSFAGNNPRYSNKEAEMKMLIQKYNYSKEFIDHFFRDLDTVMMAYIDLTKNLAQSMRAVDFVLRPHPFESHKIYHEHFAHLPNVKIDGSGTSADWLWKTQALIHYECSTAIEAAFLKKPNFSLGQFKDMRPNPFIQSLTEYALDENDLKNRLQAVLDKNYQWSSEHGKNLSSVEDQIYFQVDGKTFARISQAISQWFSKEFTRRSSLQKMNAFKEFSFYGLRSLAKFVARGRVVPEGKAILATELSQICRQLEGLLNLRLESHPVSLSSSFQISSGKN